ncbi:hypothetical protein LPJ53_000907 [Coemansia erecta]|uniref:HSF-type DNA-binding domain-containing protein n=1 Tax=Coemansia erecta TaxID=147472 RepID=A0A9W8CTB9_9FUNG|nr:hypothetical protein LPJ53_000907 [Coemansia erecta]
MEQISTEQITSWEPRQVATTPLKSVSLDAHLPLDSVSASFANLSQTMPIKTSAIGGPIGVAYDSPSMIFNQGSIAVTAAEMVAALTTVMSSTLPASVSLSEFGTVANTPVDMRLSTNSSPSLVNSGLVSQKSSSPASMISGPTYPTMTSVPSLPTMLPNPIPRDDLLIDTRHSFLHSKAPSISYTGNGLLSGNNTALNSGDSTGYSLSTHPAQPNSKPDATLFPSLLHRICDDPTMDNIAFWDENEYVCIPVMENLRLQLNTMGMTANHTDSLQKNFNDYQFFRRTDQRRIRHTSEQGVVKFSNPYFLPGREDLLHQVVRKSALKKMNNVTGRDRSNTQTPSRKKAKAPVVRQGNNPRMPRQSTYERLNPYGRYGPADTTQMQGFPLSVSHSQSIPQHQSGLTMPMNMLQTDFGMPGSMAMMDRADVPMISPAPNSALYFDQSTPGFSHSPSGFAQNASSNLGMSSMMPSHPMQINTPSQYESSISMPSGHLQYQSQFVAQTPQQNQARDVHVDEYSSNQQYHDQYFFASANGNPSSRSAMY